MLKKIVAVAVLSLGLLVSANAVAKGLDFNILSATPVGSWQVREDTHKDHKGKESILVMKSSLLSTEMRDGQQHYWIEMVMNSYKVKRGKRKQEGEQVVMKSLVPESTFSGDPANVLSNLRGFGVEMIMQNGDQDPMIIRGSGGMFSAMMQSMGTEVNYTFDELGSEQVSVPAGTFATKKVQGSGTTETKVMFRKFRVESDSTVWLSDEIPFGTVKTVGTSTTNGKKSSFSSVLVEYGTSGAKSLITKTPQEMPSIPGFN